VAAAVKVEELPEAIEAGLAYIVTVAAAVDTVRTADAVVEFPEASVAVAV